MSTKHRILIALILVATVGALAVSQIVSAASTANPSALLLRPEEVGATARIQAEVRLDSQQPGPVTGYLDGARIDFMVPTSELRFGNDEARSGNTSVVNFAYRFATSKLAEMEFDRIQSEVTANQGRILKVAVPKTDSWRVIAFEASLEDELTGTTIRWLFAQQGEYITALMMPGPVTSEALTQTPHGGTVPYGEDNASRYNTDVGALFDRLGEKLVSR